MTEKTKGIFLHYLHYSDSSVIASIYTEKFGQQAYLVHRKRRGKSGTGLAHFQPLFMLDMEVSYKPGRSLQYLRETKLDGPFLNIPFDIMRSSQAMLVAEVLLKCLKEEEPHKGLFDYLVNAIRILDSQESGIANFSVAFLFGLTKYLGIFPRLPEKGQMRLFDLISASFINNEPAHNMFMNVQTTMAFTQLFSVGLSNLEELHFNNHNRTVLLLCLLKYYKIHVDFPGEVRSLGVLKDVLT